MPISWVGLRGASPYVKPEHSRRVGGRQILGTDAAGAIVSEDEESRSRNSERQRTAREYSRSASDDRPGVGGLLAAKAMSAPVISVEESTSLARARALYLHYGFHHFPVLASDKSLCGILTEPQILNSDAVAVGTGALVSSVMQRRVLTATLDTPLRTIARVMVDENLSVMPIINSSRKVVGIITYTDVLRCIVEHSPLDLSL